jgi:hypothetical protein
MKSKIGKMGKKLNRKVPPLRFITAEKLAGKFDAPCNPTLAEAELIDAHAAEFPLSRFSFFPQGQGVRGRARVYEREAISLRERALRQIK